MSGGGDELLSTVLSCLAWLFSLFDLVIGGVALARLKTTPAGVLLGAGFILLGLTGMGTKALRLAVDATGEDGLTQFVGIGITGSCGNTLWMLVIAVGFLLLPSSLEKLGGRERVGVREG